MSRPEGSFYSPLVWMTSAALLFSGIALLLLMLAATIGPFRFLTMSLEEKREAFGLWVSADEPHPPELARRLHAWRSVAPRDRGYIESPSLTALAESGVGTIAVADARSLSEQDIRELEEFLAAGGGALVTGSIGVRDERGGWRGYESMMTLLDTEQIVPLPANRSGGLRAFHRGPLSASLEPGQALALIAEPGVPSLADAGAELQWVDSEDSTAGFAASKRLRHGRGRLVWIAAGPESAIQAGGERWRPLVRLFHSAIDWAGGRPILEVLPWPGGAPFAGRIEVAAAAVAADTTLPPPTPEDVAHSIARGLREAQATGGFTLVEIPAGALPTAIASKLVSRGEADLGSRGAWITKRGEVSAWLRQRSSIDTALDRAGPQRLLIRVSNHGRETVRAVVLRVHLNDPIESAKLTTTTLLQRRPEVRVVPGAEFVDVVLPELPGRSNHAYTLDYQPARTGKLES